MFWIAIAMTIIANLAYNICSKMTASVNPLVALAVTYSVALMTCLILYPFSSNSSDFFVQIKHVNLASVILGFSIVLLESGFILAFRSGWSLSYAALFSNGVVSILLIPISILVFRNHFSIFNAMGMFMATVGLWLMLK